MILEDGGTIYPDYRIGRERRFQLRIGKSEIIVYDLIEKSAICLFVVGKEFGKSTVGERML